MKLKNAHLENLAVGSATCNKPGDVITIDSENHAQYGFRDHMTTVLRNGKALHHFANADDAKEVAARIAELVPV